MGLKYISVKHRLVSVCFYMRVHIETSCTTESSNTNQNLWHFIDWKFFIINHYINSDVWESLVMFESLDNAWFYTCIL